MTRYSIRHHRKGLQYIKGLYYRLYYGYYSIVVVVVVVVVQ